MSDHDFEKEVQSRMGEFRLRPSEAIWTTVEKRVRQKRRRRKVILWLPVLLLTMGAAGYFINELNSNNSSDSKKFTHTTTSNNVTGTPDPSKSPDAAREPAPENNAGTTQPGNADQPSTPVPAGDANKTADSPDQPVAIHRQPSENENDRAADQPAVHTGRNNARAGNETRANTGKITAGNKGNKNYTGNNRRNNTLNSSNNKERSKQPVNREIMEAEENFTGEKNNTHDDLLAFTALPSLDNANSTGTVDTRKLGTPSERSLEVAPINPGLSKLFIERKKPSNPKWQWGVKAYGGASHIAKGGIGDLFSKSQVEDLSKNDADITGNPSGPNSFGLPTLPPSKNNPSSIRMGKSYSAGFFVQKPIARKLSLSAAVQYSYMSVHTQVGYQEDKTLSVSNGLNSQVVREYYQGSSARQGALPMFAYAPVLQDYTNRYHFIEAPITLHTQLNKGKRVPLILDMGVIVSRLVNTNALHYDGVNDVYYENDDFYNKWQLGLGAGFNVGLFPNAAHPLWIGPRINYQATNLVKKDISEGQHLWSFGLSAKFFLKN